MPPQPLSYISPNTLIRIDAPFQARPLLGGYVAEIIQIGAMIDHTWSLVLVSLLKTDPKTGIAMYQALTSAEAKRAALLAASKTRLNEDDDLLIRACLKAAAPARKVRNSFAHHIWGHSNDLPEDLLLCDPEELLRVNVDAAEANNTMAQTRQVTSFDPLNYSRVQVWRASYFMKAVEDAMNTLYTVREIDTGLQFFGPGICDATRNLLLSRPQVAQALETLSKRTTPSTPPSSP